MDIKTIITHKVELTKEDRAILEKMESFFENMVEKLDDTFFFKGEENTVYTVDNVYYVVNFLSDFTKYIEEQSW